MNATTDAMPSRLLSPGDPAPLVVANEGGAGRIVLVCEHAGRAIPAALGQLGLEPADLDRHIAWDIGAGELARLVARALDAPLLAQAYSRLVVDCNRAPEHPDLIVQTADGTAVPGNRGLGPAEVRARLEEIHAPFHGAIAAMLDARAGARPLLVSIHSFTPRMDGQDRPWHVGVLHLAGSALSERMLGLLEAEGDLVVGRNQPYAMDGTDYTIPRHAIGRGIDYLELEVRQDLIAEQAGRARMAARLAPLLARSAAEG